MSQAGTQQKHLTQGWTVSEAAEWNSSLACEVTLNGSLLVLSFPRGDGMVGLVSPVTRLMVTPKMVFIWKRVRRSTESNERAFLPGEPIPDEVPNQAAPPLCSATDLNQVRLGARSSLRQGQKPSWAPSSRFGSCAASTSRSLLEESHRWGLDIDGLFCATPYPKAFGVEWWMPTQGYK